MKIDPDSMMDECMNDTRLTLISAGIIDASTPPMFVADAVIAKFRKLENRNSVVKSSAVEWLRSRASAQDVSNAKWPEHAELYAQWRLMPIIARQLADQLEALAPGCGDGVG